MSSASRHTILRAENLQFSYEQSGPLIRDLSFSVEEGEFIALLGANGSGKSTVLKLAAGILRPLSGSVALWGKALRSYRNRDRAKLISYLPQSLDITVPFTVGELVSMGHYPYDIPPVLSVDEALGLVGLTEKRVAYLGDLSGGERRRTFIAMTLVQGAGLLLMDEPLANLDVRYQIDLLRLLMRLRDERGISVVMALHDMNLALRFARVMLVKDGEVVSVGPPARVLTEENIREAFGVDVKIIDRPGGTPYISYAEDLTA